ncbi:hypothetical protein RJE46_14330 [Cedecea neteri]|uniref:hypothetical protein n=1 Tax=Cedecea neteri TaxID=158822 RepID=UPI002892FB86|nr:hypothetical protein [Cedecea neteri]WNJ77810.1 hypothetical protein RJE46_14330 [Cedecea neteri]
MGFPSPAADYVASRLTVDVLVNFDANCRLAETADGYAVIRVSRRPVQGDHVLIEFCGKMEFARLMGSALITQDGEAIEGEALNDVNVQGVVTHWINRVSDDQEIV